MGRRSSGHQRMVGRLLRRGALVATTLGATIAILTSPVAGVAGFGDVPEGRYFTEPVQWMVDHDLTTGVSPTCFIPSRTATRAEAAAFIWRMEGEPAPGVTHRFTDVTRVFQQAPVSWMANNGITTGTTATTFSPERPVTRAEFAVFLHRLAGEPAPGPAHDFTDVSRAWQQHAVSWMANNGITTGTTATTFSPERPMSRGEAATFLHRYEGEPATVVDPAGPACLPWHRGAVNATPAEAVQEFVGFIGLTDATLGEFQQGDSRSGEIEIDTADEPGTATGSPTTALVRLDSSDNWVVIGAVSGALDVRTPAPDATVSSLMRMVFENNAISSGVVLQVWLDGADKPVVDRTVAVGGGVLPLDTWDINVELPPGASGPATLILRGERAGGEATFVSTQRVVIAP